MNYMVYANSPIMWITCGIAVSTVAIQAIIFTRKALIVGKKMGITQEQINTTVKVTALSSLGPILSVVAGVVSLLISMGGPISWLRLGFIGSVGYELSTAGFGAAALGTSLGSPDYDGVALANSFLAMWFGASGWLLTTALFTHKLDIIRTKLAGSEKMLPIVSAAAMAGAFAYLSFDHVFTYDPGKIVSVITGFIVMSLLNWLERKKNVKWVKEWGITVSMLSGPIVASIIFL